MFRWKVTSVGMDRVSRRRTQVMAKPDSQPANEREEVIEADNPIFSWCRSPHQVEAAYEAFWNNLNHETESIVKVVNVEQLH